MQSDTDLIREMRDYIQQNAFISLDDVVSHFTSKGVSEEKLEYILREIIQ